MLLFFVLGQFCGPYVYADVQAEGRSEGVGDYLTDVFEEVFLHEEGDISCRCTWDVGFTDSQVLANDGVDIMHLEFEELVSGCHGHCVGMEAEVLGDVLQSHLVEADEECVYEGEFVAELGAQVLVDFGEVM